MKKQKAKCRNLTLFYFLLMLVPLIPYSKVLPEIINAIIFIIVVFFLIFKFKDSFRKQEVYLLIFFLLGLVSVFISRDKIISLLDSFNILILVPIYLIAKNLSTAEKEKSMNYVLYGGILAAFLSIIRYLSYADLRLDGLFNYANTTAIYFAICSVIFFNRKFEGYIINIGMAITSAALLLTQSRGGLIIYVLALLYMIIMRKQNRQVMVLNIILYEVFGSVFALLIYYRQYVGLVLLLPTLLFLKNGLKIRNKKIVWSLYSGIFIGFIIMIFELLKKSIKSGAGLATLKERFVFYEDGFKLLTHNLLGIGAGRFSSEQFSYQTAVYDIKYVHNGFLQIAIDYGVIFFLFYVILILFKLIKNGDKESFSSSYFIVIVMVLLHSMIDFSMSFIYINILLWFCIGAMDKESYGDYKGKAIYGSFVGVFVAVSLMAVILVPGEFLYDFASYNMVNTTSNYNILKVWYDFPLKTVRYYDRLAVLDSEMYDKNKDKSYLKEATLNLDRCLLSNGKDARILELKGKISYAGGQIKEASLSLEESIKLRKYYIPNYDALLQCYYTLYKSSDVNSKESKDYALKIRGLTLDLNNGK